MSINPFIKAAFLLAVSIWSAQTGYSQNESDVQRLSNQFVLGTARFNGLGGAMGSVGGDFSALTINPAGVGIYRFGDVSFTPAVETNAIDAELGNQTTSKDLTRFVINNFGVVFANELEHPHWKMLNFAVSYQRMNTFNDELTIPSSNPVDRSFLQTFVNEADGSHPDDLSEFSALMAWEGFVIDTLENATSYIGRGGVSGEMTQIQTAERKGNTSDFSISLGANYKDFLYIGAGLGFQSVKYDLEVNTAEFVNDLKSTDLREFTFQEMLATEGFGVNFKVGAILKLGKVVRVGGSIQTPTTYSLTDTYQNKLTSRLTNPDEHFNLESSIGIFEYRVRTPWRYMASISGVFKKRALLTAQYEFVNFASGELKNARNNGGIDANFGDANYLVDTQFDGQHTLRGGIELRATENFYFRYGMAYFTNVISANEFTDADLDRIQYGGGIGYKTATYNIDLSYQLTKVDELYYTHSGAELTTLHNNLQSIALTVGIRL